MHDECAVGLVVAGRILGAELAANRSDGRATRVADDGEHDRVDAGLGALAALDGDRVRAAHEDR